MSTSPLFFSVFTSFTITTEKDDNKMILKTLAHFLFCSLKDSADHLKVIISFNITKIKVGILIFFCHSFEEIEDFRS